MNITKIKVNYLPILGYDGTIYRCNVKINQDLFNLFIAELDKYTEEYKDCFLLNRPIENKGEVYFLNLTQGEILKNWLLKLHKNNKITINPKRLLFDANVSIIIS